MNDSPKRFVAYYRCSTAEQRTTGRSIETQRELVTTAIEERGYIIEREFEEVISGRSAEKVLLWEAVEYAKETGCTLIVSHVDRLTRNPEEVMRLAAGSIKIVCLQPHITDLTQLMLYAMMAHHETTRISERTREALRANPKMYTFCRSKKYSPELAKIAQALYRTGLSPKYVRKHMDMAGYRLKTGERISYDDVKNLLFTEGQRRREAERREKKYETKITSSF